MNPRVILALTVPVVLVLVIIGAILSDGTPEEGALDIADELLDRDREGDGLFTDLRGLDGMLLRQAAEVSTDERVHEASRGELGPAQLLGRPGVKQDRQPQAGPPSAGRWPSTTSR